MKRIRNRGIERERKKNLAADPIAKAVKLADLQDNANPLRQSVWTEHVETRMKKHLMAYRYLTGAEDTEA